MRKIIAFLILSLTILPYCSNTVQVKLSNYKSIVPMGANLHFEFNQDIVPENKVGTWDTTQYIVFEPALKGKFKWKSPRELVFSPYGFLRPATQYSASFNKDAAGLIVEDDENLNFHTPYLNLEQFNAYYAKLPIAGNREVVRFDLDFNYKINPRDLKNHLSIKIDNQIKKVELLGHEHSNKISLYMTGFPKDNKSHEVQLILKKGINVSNVSVGMSDIVKTTRIIDPQDFKIDKIIAEHDGFTGTITVTATQDISPANIRSFIEIMPTVSYTAQVKGRQIIIKSDDFDVAKTYVINIKEGLTGTMGGKLKYEYTEEISFGTIEPDIKFINQKAEYLSANGHKNIEVRIVSIPEVEVKIYKVYKNNLLQYSSGSSYNDYYYDDYYSSVNDPGNLGDVVWKKSIQTASLPKINSSRLFKMDFTDKVANLEGIYVIEIRSKDKYWLKDRKIVSISDIGLIAKQGKNQITIFANSIKTAKALSGVQIEVFGKNNQSLGKVNTDNQGVAIFNLNENNLPGFTPALITARLNNDFNYLPYSKTAIGTSRFEIAGRTDNLSGYDAYIYPERDIYRPGETIHLATILRDDNWNIPGEIPLKLKLIAPNGKTFVTLKKTLDKFGSFTADIKLPQAAPTGGYTAEVYTTTNVYLNSIRIKVEEFVPDRIKVKATTNKKDIRLSDALLINLQVNNLFGPPAANRKYEIQQNIKRKYFYSKKYYDYNFTIKGGSNYFRSNVRKGKTNQQGAAVETYKFPVTYANMGLLQADYYITVFDETGRPVNRKKVVNVYTQNAFLGIKINDYYNKTNQMMKIPLIAVDKNDNALSNVQAQLKLIKHEYRTVLAKSGSYYRYKSEHQEIVLQNKLINFKGDNTVFNFTPKTSGKYEIRIAKAGTKTYVSQTFYAYGWGSTTTSSFAVNTEGYIDIQLDKEKYKVGDKAHVILKTPFSGKILVTLEQKNVNRHFYLNTDKRSAAFDLKITDNFVPNVYISATLIKAHDVSDIPLTVAHGYAPVLVENSSNKLNVSISAVEKSHSRTKQRITVKSAPNTPITLAIVDEGILQVTGFKSPNPYRFFYRKRALGVRSYDIYPFLFPEIAMKSGIEGGGAGELEKRINPMTNKRFKLVSYWSGVLTTDNSGKAYYDIEIPEFSGDLRIMAVAYKGKAFGSAEAHMKVADPVVISTALPRFLSPKDTVEMGLTLSNTTNQPMNCVLGINTGKNIKMLDAVSGNINIPANSEKQMYLKLAVVPSIGQATVKVNVSVGGKNYTNTTDISIRPPSPLQKVSGSGNILAGSNKQINMNLGRFMPNTIERKLILSNSPMIKFSKHLDYLLGYPYGCVEQTISKAFPQLYYADLVKSLGKKSTGDPNYYIKEAIRKLQLMQLYNGAMSYWPGYGQETWWGSVYAAHFLVEAQKAGYQVDKTMLDKLYKYLKTKLKNRKTINYRYNGTLNKKIAPKEVAYSLYVMALMGKPNISTMNYYKSRRDLLSLDSKYLLAAAYALAGDKKKYAQILPPAYAGETSNKVSGGSFYSPIRDLAISLYALLEVDPDNQEIGSMARALAENMHAARWMNTQERVFAFLAMGKIAQNASKADLTAKIMVNNRLISTYKKGTLSLSSKQLVGDNINVTTKGKGKLYYFWEAEGIAADGSYKEEDNYLRVRRTFYDRTGTIISGNTFKQNDLIVIRISLQSLRGMTIENVVISDILPAGFEIENPRISSVAGMNWIKNKSYPEYMDIRDDRINYFTAVGTKTKYFYYMVRAVTPGTFQMGPVGADAMYNGEYHSYNGGGVIKIVR